MLLVILFDHKIKTTIFLNTLPVWNQFKKFNCSQTFIKSKRLNTAYHKCNVKLMVI